MATTSPLRQRMIEDMTIRNLSQATQQSYIYAVRKFSRHFGRSPDRLGIEDVRAYQLHLIAQKGFVTLPCRDREESTPQELSGRCDCSPPRGHRNTAKRAVRVGGDEMALDVESVVDGGVRGKKFLG